MSSTYTGTAFPPLGQDGTPPRPSAVPKLTIPIDGDPLNASSVYSLARDNADFIAWLQGSAKYHPPVFPGGGFSSVTHTGGGTGTVTPGGTSNGGLLPVVKIMGNGGLGVGTFQFSNDGGVTYGATTTIPGGGTYNDGSGISATFSGTFTATDTYQFWTADTPQAVWVDSGAHVRHGIDHTGFPTLGRRSEFRCEWIEAISEANTGSVNVTDIFQSNTGSSANSSVITQAAGALASYPACTVKLRPDDTNGYFSWIQTRQLLFLPSTNVSLVLEFDAAMTTVGANNRSWVLGLSTQADATAATACIRFQKVSANTNWFVAINNAGAPSAVDSGVPPVANTFQRFRIEYHGASTPAGFGDADGLGSSTAKARFFINGTRVYSGSAAALTNTMYLILGGYSAGAGGGQLYVGPVLMTWNRWLTPDSL